MSADNAARNSSAKLVAQAASLRYLRTQRRRLAACATSGRELLEIKEKGGKCYNTYPPENDPILFF
jgi:hypothetical protein